MEKKICGINGFGRFSLHLLRYWLYNIGKSGFNISFINDDYLSINDIYKIIKNDRYVKFNNFQIKKKKNSLVFLKNRKKLVNIQITKNNHKKISWVGVPDIFLECSGKNTKKKDCKKFLLGKTKLVMISATSYDCDQTLIYGFNQEKYKKESKVISYGSCTVDAYVPLANWINKLFKIVNADLNIIHNIPEYKIKKDGVDSIIVRPCTLETVGPQLLFFLNKNNFHINYTMIPYSGVSIIDLRFQIKKKTNVNTFKKLIKQEINNKSLKNLYSLEKKDKHPNYFKLSKHSANLIEETIKIKDNNLFIHAYFDNENSANRYFDLLNYISKENN